MSNTSTDAANSKNWTLRSGQLQLRTHSNSTVNTGINMKTATSIGEHVPCFHNSQSSDGTKDNSCTFSATTTGAMRRTSTTNTSNLEQNVESECNTESPKPKATDSDRHSALIRKRTAYCYSNWWSFSRLRAVIGAFINDTRVQLFIVCLIVINALLMGVATFDLVTNSPSIQAAFETTDQVFLSVFTVEIALQLLHHGLRPVLTDGWLCFDLVVVVASWSLESMQIVRALRVFRVLRLVTKLTTLRKLVQALFEVTPAVSAIISLLLLIMYIYAVLCTTLFGHLYDDGVTDRDYFSRLDTSLFTLLQFVTLEWADIVRQVVSKYYWAWIVFITFLTLTSIILYSLIVAVVCDAVSQTEHANDEPKEKDLNDASALEQIQQLQQRVAQLTYQQEHLSKALKQCLQELSNRLTADEDEDGSSETSNSEEERPSPEPWTGVVTGPKSVHFDLTVNQR
jgi:Ion transport protein